MGINKNQQNNKQIKTIRQYLSVHARFLFGVIQFDNNLLTLKLKNNIFHHYH